MLACLQPRYLNIMILFVCLFVCSLIAWEQVRLLPSDFQGSSRAPQGWFLVQNMLGSWGKKLLFLHF